MITDEDIKMLLLKKIMYFKSEIVNKSYKTVGMIDGNIRSGSYNFNADSDVRRTCKMDVCLKKCNFDFNDTVFFNYYIKIYIGYYSFISKTILYYNMGVYAFDKNSYTYDAQTNNLSLDLSDLCILMDADHMGTQFGALNPCIYAVNPETGQRFTEPDRIVLKNIVIGLLKDFGIKKYRVDDIGIHSKKDTDEYKWNELPYDLEFSTGVGLLEILTTIKNMYPYYEFFFDIDGTFIFQEKPNSEYDPIVLDETIIDNLYISENKDNNVYDVKNVVEVWGTNFDMKDGRFADTSSFYRSSGSYVRYSVTLDNFIETSYVDGMFLAIKIANTNVENTTYININSLGNKTVYDKLTGQPLVANKIVKGNTYVFEYSFDKGGFYFLGTYQIHAVSILTNGSMNNTYYTEETQRAVYFAEKYNTTAVSFIVDANSPYCIENIGEVRKVLEGDKIANLDTLSLALDFANDRLDRLSRRINPLNLEMVAIPWLDVNQKIKYTPNGSTTAKTYLTKTISGDFMSDKMTLGIVDFYASLDEE